MRVKKRVLILCGLALACGHPDVDWQETGSRELPYIGSGVNPNPLTFWWYAGAPAVLRPGIECSLSRIRAATCLPVDVSFDAHHWVRQYPAADMGGLTGRTLGTWDSTRIRVTDAADADHACRILVHEIAEHVLRRRSDHATTSGNSKLTEPLLTSICEMQDCGCFNPEH